MSVRTNQEESAGPESRKIQHDETMTDLMSLNCAVQDAEIVLRATTGCYLYSGTELGLIGCPPDNPQ